MNIGLQNVLTGPANVVQFLLEIGDTKVLLLNRYKRLLRHDCYLPIYYSAACNPDIHVTCVLCEASASLLSKKIKNLPIKTIKEE